MGGLGASGGGEAGRGSGDLVQAALRTSGDEPQPTQDTTPVGDCTPVSGMDRQATHRSCGLGPRSTLHHS